MAVNKLLLRDELCKIMTRCQNSVMGVSD